MTLKPEDGGLFEPKDHPSPTVALDDYRRGLNTMVEATRHVTENESSFEIRMAACILAIQMCGVSEDEILYLLAAAIDRLVQLS